jgi:hypothetical protein
MVPHHLGADMLGLGLHLLHQPGTLDHVAEPRVIFDVRGGRQLAARLDALDDDRCHARACRVNRGGHAGRAGAEDDHACRMGGNHICLTCANGMFRMRDRVSPGARASSAATAPLVPSPDAS